MTDFDPKEVIDTMNEEPQQPLTGYSEPRYVVSFINNQPGLVVRGNTAKEIESSMQAILPYFKRFRLAVEKAKETKQSAGNDATKRATAYCKDCGEEMVYKTGFGKKGKWEAMMCPNSKKGEDGHPPVWL